MNHSIPNTMKTTLLLLVLLQVLTVQALFSQPQLQIRHTGGDHYVVLALLSKITFPDGNLKIDYVNATTDFFPIANIQRITFGENTSSNVETLTEPSSNVPFYPNPARESITFTKPHITHVQIYTLQGQRVMSLVKPNLGQVNIAHLPAGVYVLVVQNRAYQLIKL